MTQKSIMLYFWLDIKKMEHGLLRTLGVMDGERKGTLELPIKEALA